jgi:predicted glycosyltransferase
MRLMVYSHDTFGLGNIRRMLAICKYLHDTIEDVSILIVTGSPMLHSFRVTHGIDYIKLPCLKRDTAGDLGVRFLDLESDDIIRLRSQIIQTAVRSFKPDVVLVDKKPTGLAGEMEPALRAIRSALPESRVLLVMRDILDEPAATIKQWRNGHYDEAVAWFYDSVLVLGSQAIFDVRKEYAFPPEIASKVLHCGYIRREKGQKTRKALRRELKVSDRDNLVLVTVGGGEDGYQLLSAYLSGLAIVPPSKQVRSLVITGPELPPARSRVISDMAASSPFVQIFEFTDDMMSYMDAADVVVSMGGYNSICELLTLKKHAVVVPRVEPVAEQRIRAERLAGLAQFQTILPAGLKPSLLMHAVLQEIDRARRGEEIPDLVELDALPRISRLIASFRPDAELGELQSSMQVCQAVA